MHERDSIRNKNFYFQNYFKFHQFIVKWCICVNTNIRTVEEDIIIYSLSIWSIIRCIVCHICEIYAHVFLKYLTVWQFELCMFLNILFQLTYFRSTDCNNKISVLANHYPHFIRQSWNNQIPWWILKVTLKNIISIPYYTMHVLFKLNLFQSDSS